MTIVIIIITVFVSIYALTNAEVFSKLRFNPYSIKNFSNQWYRFFSYGVIHASWMHLAINMFVLYSFGDLVETYFGFYFGLKAHFLFLLLYIGAIFSSVIFSFEKNKNNIAYNAVGASGAVSAVVFASILFNPTMKIFLFFVPIGIPAVIFGVIYLIYSAYMSKKNVDNIGHDAHFFGAVFGIVFTIILKPKLVLMFIEQVSAYFS
jgi:membrane associated rhomboid family serine protease